MCSKLERVPCQIRKTTRNHPGEVAKKGAEVRCGMYSPTNAVARKTPWKGIKENTLQCYIEYSKIILREKGAGLNT